MTATAKRALRALCFVASLLSGISLPGAEPTTPEQRKRFVEITHALEGAPFGKTAASHRAWAANLIDQAPDIKLRINVNLLRELVGSKVPDTQAIFGQFILGFASFTLEHPDADEEAAAYVAAFVSSLRVYRKAIHRNPGNRIEFFDALSEREREGTLRKHVEQLLSERKPNG